MVKKNTVKVDIEELSEQEVALGSKTIRTIDTLETRRVTISQEIESLLATGKDRDSLDRVKALRLEQGELLDELSIAKNLEKGKRKDEWIGKVKVSEQEARKAHSIILELAAEVLPKLRELEPVFAEIAKANWRLDTANTQIDSGNRALQVEYGETGGVKSPGIGIIHQIHRGSVRDVIQRLEGILGIESIVPQSYLDAGFTTGGGEPEQEG